MLEVLGAEEAVDGEERSGCEEGNWIPAHPK